MTPVAARTVTAWRQDLDQVAADIRSLHPDPFTKTGRLTFARRLAALRDRLPELSEEQRVVEAMRWVASIGDGSTHLEPYREDFTRWYPVRFHAFSDGLFVTGAHQSVRELAGAQVLEIAGHPAAAVMDAARELVGADNAMGSREGIYALHSARLMQGLGLADVAGALRVRVRLRDGIVVERTLTPAPVPADATPRAATFDWRLQREMFGPPYGLPSEWIGAYQSTPVDALENDDASRPAHLAKPGHTVMRSMPEHDALYARMDLLDDHSLPFVERVVDQADRQKPRRLIIDWRYNAGGDGSRVQAMSRELIRRGPAPPWRELYLLTGGRTSGAAVMALNALLGQVPLTIVGEPPGAPLNAFGDAVQRTYARTGLRLDVSTRWWQLGSSDDLREYLSVDVAAPFSGADYVAGKDPAIDAILRGDEMRSIPVIAREAGGAAARAALADRRRRFATYTWWKPPSEPEMRRACVELREQKRWDDALEMCALNAELYPDDWSPWYNLGYTQRLAGKVSSNEALLSAGLSSYRCIEVVDPGKFEEEGIRQFLAEKDPDHRAAPPAGCPRP